jgi:hypothetical protein
MVPPTPPYQQLKSFPPSLLPQKPTLIAKLSTNLHQINRSKFHLFPIPSPAKEARGRRSGAQTPKYVIGELPLQIQEQATHQHLISSPNPSIFKPHSSTSRKSDN